MGDCWWRMHQTFREQWICKRRQCIRHEVDARTHRQLERNAVFDPVTKLMEENLCNKVEKVIRSDRIANSFSRCDNVALHMVNQDGAHKESTKLFATNDTTSHCGVKKAVTEAAAARSAPPR